MKDRSRSIEKEIAKNTDKDFSRFKKLTNRCGEVYDDFINKNFYSKLYKNPVSPVRYPEFFRATPLTIDFKAIKKAIPRADFILKEKNVAHSLPKIGIFKPTSSLSANNLQKLISVKNLVLKGLKKAGIKDSELIALDSVAEITAKVLFRFHLSSIEIAVVERLIEKTLNTVKAILEKATVVGEKRSFKIKEINPLIDLVNKTDIEDFIALKKQEKKINNEKSDHDISVKRNKLLNETKNEDLNSLLQVGHKKAIKTREVKEIIKIDAGCIIDAVEIIEEKKYVLHDFLMDFITENC